MELQHLSFVYFERGPYTVAQVGFVPKAIPPALVSQWLSYDYVHTILSVRTIKIITVLKYLALKHLTILIMEFFGINS